jgi:hypothetical protein
MDNHLAPFQWMTESSVMRLVRLPSEGIRLQTRDTTFIRDTSRQKEVGKEALAIDPEAIE